MSKNTGILLCGGIYGIFNSISKMYYIGSAINFHKRKRDHISLLNNNNHDNIYLQRAWNKYGGENFEFRVFEFVRFKDDLVKREQWYIDYFKPSIYNICKVAGSCLGKIVSEETKIKISSSAKGKKKLLESLAKRSATVRKNSRWPCADGFRCKCPACKVKRSLHRNHAPKRAYNHRGNENG